jgi:hypothetical protein
MFEFVNPIAVIGTSCFMCALGVLWYSDYLFKKPWLKAVHFTDIDLQANAKQSIRLIFLTLVSYLTTVYLLALAIAYAQLFDLPVQKLASLVALGLVSMFAGFVLWERRSLIYFLITAGFGVIFIFASTFFLYYWPW